MIGVEGFVGHFLLVVGYLGAGFVLFITLIAPTVFYWFSVLRYHIKNYLILRLHIYWNEKIALATHSVEVQRPQHEERSHSVRRAAHEAIPPPRPPLQIRQFLREPHIDVCRAADRSRVIG